MARTKTDSEALDHGPRAMEDIGTVSFPRAKPHATAAVALNPVASAQASTPMATVSRRLTDVNELDTPAM